MLKQNIACATKQIEKMISINKKIWRDIISTVYKKF